MTTREKVQSLPKPIQIIAFAILATIYLAHCIVNDTGDMPEGWDKFFNQP